MRERLIPADMQAEYEVVEALRREVGEESLAADAERLEGYRDRLKAYRDARRAFDQKWADILDTYREPKPED